MSLTTISVLILSIIGVIVAQQDYDYSQQQNGQNFNQNYDSMAMDNQQQQMPTSTMNPWLARLQDPVKTQVMGLANRLNGTYLSFVPQQLQSLYDNQFPSSNTNPKFSNVQQNY